MAFMPRKARIDYPGGMHHLIVRGITSDTTSGESGGETGSEVNRKETPKTQRLDSYISMDVPPLSGESCPEDNFL
jgi:hypothetical protein